MPEWPRIWVAQGTQPRVVRGDQYGTRAEQLPVAQDIAECRYASVIKTATRFVEQE
jgi:hypothetical protein